MSIMSGNTKLVKRIVQCVVFNNMDIDFITVQRVITNFMVGDYCTQERAHLHEDIRIWANSVKNWLSNSREKDAALDAEIERWNMFINILDHVTLQITARS